MKKVLKKISLLVAIFLLSLNVVAQQGRPTPFRNGIEIGSYDTLPTNVRKGTIVWYNLVNGYYKFDGTDWLPVNTNTTHKTYSHSVEMFNAGNNVVNVWNGLRKIGTSQILFNYDTGTADLSQIDSADLFSVAPSMIAPRDCYLSNVQFQANTSGSVFFGIVMKDINDNITVLYENSTIATESNDNFLYQEGVTTVIPEGAILYVFYKATVTGIYGSYGIHITETNGTSFDETYVNNGGGGSADGVVSDVSLEGTNLVFTGSNGGANKSVPLASLQDGTGTDDQTASEVIYTPYLTITSTELQGAINELKDELDLLDVGTVNYGSAQRIPFINSTNDGFDYSLNLTWDGLSFYVDGNIGLGNETPTEKLEVSGGSVLANGYKTPAGTNDDVLLADGTTTSLSGLSGGDDFGGHTATQNVDMDAFSIVNASTVQSDQIITSQIDVDDLYVNESFNAGFNTLNNVGDGILPTDAVNKSQLDALSAAIPDDRIRFTLHETDSIVTITEADILASKSQYFDVTRSDNTTPVDTVLVYLPEVPNYDNTELVLNFNALNSSAIYVVPDATAVINRRSNTIKSYFLPADKKNKGTLTTISQNEWFENNEWLVNDYAFPSPPSVNLITNGEFNDATDIYLEDANWTVANGVASFSGAATSRIGFVFTEALSSANSYTVTFEVSNTTNTDLRFEWLTYESNDTFIEKSGFTDYNPTGNTYSFTFTPLNDSAEKIRLDFSSANDSVDIDNVTLRQN